MGDLLHINLCPPPFYDSRNFTLDGCKQSQPLSRLLPILTEHSCRRKIVPERGTGHQVLLALSYDGLDLPR